MIPVAPESSSPGFIHYTPDSSEHQPQHALRSSLLVSSAPCSGGSSSSSSSSSSVSSSTSFTQTFLRGILASIDSKDPLVAHAWLETLLDAIEFLPVDVVKREVIPIAVSKAQIGEAVFGRQASCRLLGKIALKLDPPSARAQVLPTVLSLGQDGDPEVRFTLCRHLPLVAKGVGLEATKDAILPQIVELSVDESSHVRVAALDTIVHLLPFLDEASKGNVIVPLMIKISERARAMEENPLLPNLAHVFGRLLHGLQPHFHPDQRHWGLNFYKSLCKSGLGPGLSSSRMGGGAKGSTMPDIVPISEDKILMHGRVRKECALNLPAMTALIGVENFDELLFQTFADLVSDTNPVVRGAVARSIQELAPLLGVRFASLELQLCALFADGSLLTLEAMVRNMVEIVDILARCGGKRGSPINFSGEISSALLHCENVISKTRNWRLHADCLEKFSCLANCISPVTILNKFVPTLFERIHNTRTLPCKVAAARTLLVFLRFTVRSEDRKFILFKMKDELCRGKSCSSRMLFLRVGDMAMNLFSKSYFKLHFFMDILNLHHDPIPNVRLKLCSILPKLKALLTLPSDSELLVALEDAVKKLLLVERDRDVLYTLQTVIQELDRTETGLDGLSSGNLEEERDNERKLREERLISNMEEQILKMHKGIVITNDSKFFSSNGTFRKRSESVPRDVLLSPREPERSPSKFSDHLPDKFSHQLILNGAESGSNGHHGNVIDSKTSFYSASLENLDPSAKEFLVDAGITLDIRKNESMPNLSRLKDEETFPKFLGNNSYVTTSSPLNIRRAETPIITEALVENSRPLTKSPDSSLKSPKGPPESKLRPPSKLKPPSNTNLPSPSGVVPTSSSSTSLIDIASVSAMAQNTLSRIPYSKLVSSTDRIQGSIERLAEKWESKRRNLTSQNNGGGNGSSNSVESSRNDDSPKSKSLILESPSKSTMIPSKRNSLFIANKQKMRLSLTDVTSKSSPNISGLQKQRKKSPELSAVPPPTQSSFGSLSNEKSNENLDMVEEDMVTYVPPLTTSTCTISQKAKLVTATNLIVKPLNSTTMASNSSNTSTTSSHQRSLPVPSIKYSNNGTAAPYKRNSTISTNYHHHQNIPRPKSIPPPSPAPKSNSSSIPHYSSSNPGNRSSGNTNNNSSMIPSSSGVAPPTSSNSSTYVPKFSRVPPPKYRNPPNTTVNRRPLSQQESSIRAYSQMGMRYDPRRAPPPNSQGKSLSAECILDQSDNYGSPAESRFSSPPSSSYSNTTPRLKKAERFRYVGGGAANLQRRESSRSPSPNIPESRLKTSSSHETHRYSSSTGGGEIPRRNNVESRQAQSSYLNSRRKSAHYPLSNGTQPQQQQFWNKTIPTPRNLPLSNGTLKVKSSQGLPAPGFSRLPVGSSSSYGGSK